LFIILVVRSRIKYQPVCTPLTWMWVIRQLEWTPASSSYMCVITGVVAGWHGYQGNRRVCLLLIARIFRSVTRDSNAVFPWLEDVTRGREGFKEDFLRARGRTCASTVTPSGQSYLQCPVHKNGTSRQCVCVICWCISSLKLLERLWLNFRWRLVLTIFNSFHYYFNKICALLKRKFNFRVLNNIFPKILCLT